LSDAKDRRTAAFEAACLELELAGYRRRNRTVSLRRAEAMSVFVCLPASLAAAALFFHVNRERLETLTLHRRDILRDVLVFAALVLLSVPVHELLHGIAGALFCRAHWKSVRFGVERRSLTPYCSCTEALKAPQYAAVCLLPFLVLGLLLFAVGTARCSLMLLFLSVYNMLAAGGDLLVASMVPPLADALVLDHPAEVGPAVFLPGCQA